jgi:hypothetical protein
MVGVEPEYIACGVGGSKRDSTDAVEADAVDPESLAPAPTELSSDLDIECLKVSGLRRASECEACLCDTVGLETRRRAVGGPRVGAAAIGLWILVVCAKTSRLCS